MTTISLAPYVFRQTNEFSCGQASVAIIANALTGKRLTDMDINNKWGYSLFSALNSESGKQFLDFNFTPEKFMNAICPCIIGLSGPKFSPSGRGHIVAVESISPAMIRVADPATGTMRTDFTLLDFLAAPPHPDGKWIWSLGQEVKPPAPPPTPAKPREETLEIIDIEDKEYVANRTAEVTIVIDRYKSKGVYERFIYPIVDDISVDKEFMSTPSTASFSIVIPDNPTEVTVGDHVIIMVNKTNLFQGYIDKEHIKYTYMEGNKNYYIKAIGATDIMANLALNYEFAPLKDMTSTEVIKKMCSTYAIETGEIADTITKVPQIHQDYNQSCLSVMNWHLAETFKYTGTNYIIYADEGKIHLKKIRDLVCDVICNPMTCTPCDYRQSIDKMYNCIVIVRNQHKKVQTMEQAMEQDDESIARYGRRTKIITESGNSDINIKQAAKNCLAYYKNLRRYIDIRGQAGDPLVRGGSAVFVDLPGIVSKTFMVKSAKHNITGNQYSMDLELFGGDVGEL